MIYTVELASAKRPGTMLRTDYETISEALVAVSHYVETDRPPVIYCADWRASFIAADRWGKPVMAWAMRCEPAGIYKSGACRIGEGAGVRYVSHRTGYRASRRAFARFCVEIAAHDQWCEANAEMIAANRAACQREAA